jgi:hypothetical protein
MEAGAPDNVFQGRGVDVFVIVLFFFVFFLSSDVFRLLFFLKYYTVVR